MKASAGDVSAGAFFAYGTQKSQKCTNSERILDIYIEELIPKGGRTSMSILEGWYNGRRVFADESHCVKRMRRQRA